MEVRPTPIHATRRATVPLAIALLVLGIAAAMIGMGIGSSGGGPALALTGAGAASTALPEASDGPGHDGAWGPLGAWGGGRGMPGNGWSAPGLTGGRNGGTLGQISITAIDVTKVSLKSATGWTRTIDVTGVAISRAGSSITAAGLKVGDRVVLGETRNSDGTYTLKSVTVVLDRVSGTVSRIDASTITVTGFGGGTSTITTSGATVYRRAGTTIARSDIAVGERLTASGTKASNGSLAAEAVDVQPDVVFGTVTGKSGSTLTIKTAGGGTATVTVTPGTTFKVAGKSSATLADVAVNDMIVAQGVLGSGGTLTATDVRAGTGHGFGFGKGGRGSVEPDGSAAPSASAGTSG
jgi:hypothetical protein